jgi:hypothetical protein
MVYTIYTMRRTQIYLDDEQILELKRRARQARRRVSAIIREAIDEKLAEPVPSVESDDAFKAAFGIWRDRTDLGSTDEYVRRLRQDTRRERFANDSG